MEDSETDLNNENEITYLVVWTFWNKYGCFSDSSQTILISLPTQDPNMA